jgi:methenyltetrahydrofolate cyclohydrolase
MSGAATGPSSGRATRGSFLDLSLHEFLGLLADGQPAPAAGGAVAVAVALGASLCAMVASLSARQLADAADLQARAEQLAWTTAPLADADVEVCRAVITARRNGGDVDGALSAAADVPLRVAEAGAQVVALAARLAAEGNPNTRGDALTAGLLAAAGTRASCALVRINLAAAGSDERLTRVSALLATLDLARPPHPGLAHDPTRGDYSRRERLATADAVRRADADVRGARSGSGIAQRTGGGPPVR